MSSKKKKAEVNPYEIQDEIKDIRVVGAREHNLKNVNLVIPRDKLVVFTGLSGSGKSSLAFDTLYAEGQRRYLECLSSYARQFLSGMKKPDVDLIEGLSPAISIEQKTLGSNPRSTVGTVTEIYDYLRLLYSKIGIQYCTNCNIPVEKKTIDEIISEIFKKFESKKVVVLSPVVRGRKGHYRELFEMLQKQGYNKVRVDGLVKDLTSGLQLARYNTHNIDLVVDKVIVDEESYQRIKDSVTKAIDKGEGTVVLLIEKEGSREDFWNEVILSTNYSCPNCFKSYDFLAPNNFSFNSPNGSCKECNGVGEINDFNVDLLIPDKSKSIKKGGIAFVEDSVLNWLYLQISTVVELFKEDINSPISKLSPELMKAILYGLDKEIKLELKNKTNNDLSFNNKFIGLIPSLIHLHKVANTSSTKAKYEEYLFQKPCPTCNGGRLKKDSLNVYIHGKNIGEVTSFNIEDSYIYFKELAQKLNPKESAIANLILKEIFDRLEFLINVGLTYLSLNRSARTLSGGEAQRIRLASQIGSKLVGVMYVLDEPSIGLHQHDNDKLIKSLKDLRDLGNSVIVVEHDKAMIEESDVFVDIGPRAGVHGGEVVLVEDPKVVLENKKDYSNSITAQYLLGNKSDEFLSKEREGSGLFIELKGAKGNNLRNVDLKLPLGKLVVVTGLSGSGKSTLINDTLYPIINKYINKTSAVSPLAYESIAGLEHIDKVIEIDQSPIGRTPRSNPSTYADIFTNIRDLYSMLPESKIRGYTISRFSFNVKGGKCEECDGAGMKKIEMNFLPDVFVTCDVCEGRRYNAETLQVKFKEKSIADVLDMTVEEALTFFKDIPKIFPKIKTLHDVGLDYIKLGQQSPTLSGGEAQRVKLAKELSKRQTGKTLYLLDEPTTGLHFEDIRLLNNIIQELVDKGNSVLVIEHNLDIIKSADWIIDLGPLGGKHGGQIVAEGTPKQVAKNKNSLTGKYLLEELKLKAKR